MKVKVSIPVTVGGYTGQRDAWQEFTNDYVVHVDGSKVTLKESRPPQCSITFDTIELHEAVKFATEHA